MARHIIGLRALAWGLAAVLWAPWVAAQDLPARFSVTGVAASDVLNIRAAPSAGAPILGTLAPDARGVEVLGLEGAWARLGLPEGEGWAASRFLAAEPAQDPRAAPVPLRCVGTEPFWSIAVTEAGSVFETPEETRDLRPIGRAEGFGGFVLAFDDRGETRDLTVMRAECSDGMSDRSYGFQALVWNRGEEVLEGCCFLLPK